MSIVRDPETYERFEHVVLAHGVRHVSDLGYRRLHRGRAARSTSSSATRCRQKLRYYPTVTREPFRNQGRLTDLLDERQAARRPRLPPLDPAHDRVMICGGPAMLADTVALLDARGFEEGSSDGPGHYVIERAFVQK